MSFLDDQLIKKVPCKTYTTDSAKDIQDDYERGRKAGREAAEQSAGSVDIVTDMQKLRPKKDVDINLSKPSD